MTKYSDLLADWLSGLGYTHCFFVAGGNIMHLLESCSRRMKCIPVAHEVAAGIAAVDEAAARAQAMGVACPMEATEVAIVKAGVADRATTITMGSKTMRARTANRALRTPHFIVLRAT